MFEFSFLCCHTVCVLLVERILWRAIKYFFINYQDLLTLRWWVLFSIQRSIIWNSLLLLFRKNNCNLCIILWKHNVQRIVLRANYYFLLAKRYSIGALVELQKMHASITIANSNKLALWKFNNWWVALQSMYFNDLSLFNMPKSKILCDSWICDH